MKKYKMRISLLGVLLFSSMLISGCGTRRATVAAPTPSQTVSPTHTSVPGDATNGDQAILDLPGMEIVSTLVDAAPTRTPAPTATPDVLTKEIIQFVQETGLSQKTLFWLGYADWINLGISLIYVLAGYLIGTWLIRWLLPRLVKRTKTNLDDQLLKVSADELRWLAVVLIFRFSIDRLNFVHPNIKTLIADLSFFLTLFLLVLLLWRLISLAAQQANELASKSKNQGEADSLITLMTWTLRLILIICVVAVILSHFGVNITGFAFILGVIIFALSLAGRDILTDIISGAMILIDRPFRIGDRLELPSIVSWGDVVEIGMRSTKILSVENRMVVIPNSQIGKNQVVNYSYPDPSYFNLVKVVVAYDNDPDQVSKVLVEAIRTVEGVQTEREIVAWLMELTEYQMVYWTAWWVATYTDRYPVQDRVIRVMINALKESGVVLPYEKGSMNVQLDSPSPRPEPPQENPGE